MSRARTAMLIAAMLSSWAALGQAYPSKPVRFVSQFAAGSPGDVATRVVAQQLSETLGVPVPVDNRVGGGGVLAAGVLAQAAPDGYSIGLLNTTVPVMGVAMERKFSFDAARAFTPITTMIGTASVLLGGPSLGVATLQEVIALARKYPGKLSYGTSGIGSSHHMAGEQIKIVTGAEMVHVPYKTQPLFDAAAGVLPLAYAVVPRAVPLVKSGKLKGLAIVADTRSPLMPDVPTISEILPGFDAPPSWSGLFAPAGLPVPVLRRLHAEAVRAIQSPEGRKRILAAEFEPISSKSPEEFAALIKRHTALVAHIVKTAGIPTGE